MRNSKEYNSTRFCVAAAPSNEGSIRPKFDGIFVTRPTTFCHILVEFVLGQWVIFRI